MVGARELNRDRARELVDNHIFPLYQTIKRTGTIEISTRKTEALKFNANLLQKAGFTHKQISKALDMPLKSVALAIDKKVSNKLKRAVSLFGNPFIVLMKSEEYACDYKITPQMTEYMIIEDLVRAKWTTAQIVKATGFCARRIQRVKKTITEEEYE